MLCPLSAFLDASVHAEDAPLGRASDALVDLEWFAVRYLAVNAQARRYFIPPMAFAPLDCSTCPLVARFSHACAAHSPVASEDMRAISPEFECALFEHFGYPGYWGGPYLWGRAVVPTDADHQIFPPAEEQEHRGTDFCTFSEISGYVVEDREGAVGTVRDLLIDLEDWSSQYLVVARSNRLRRWSSLLPTYRLRRCDRTRKKLVLDMSRVQVETSQEFRPGRLPPSPERLVRAEYV